MALNCGKNKKDILKESRDPIDFGRNTNSQNLFGVLYPTCIPQEIPARDRRSISRASQSSHSYSAFTQGAVMSLPDKKIFCML